MTFLKIKTYQGDNVIVNSKHIILILPVIEIIDEKREKQCILKKEITAYSIKTTVDNIIKISKEEFENISNELLKEEK